MRTLELEPVIIARNLKVVFPNGNGGLHVLNAFLFR